MPVDSLKNLNKHKSLRPLLGILGLGVIAAGAYLARLATQSPDVSWNKVTNPEPWQKQQGKQYKFYSSSIDYNKLEEPENRPKI